MVRPTMSCIRCNAVDACIEGLCSRCRQPPPTQPVPPVIAEDHRPVAMDRPPSVVLAVASAVLVAVGHGIGGEVGVLAMVAAVQAVVIVVLARRLFRREQARLSSSARGGAVGVPALLDEARI